MTAVAELLTLDELRVMDLTTEIANLMTRVIGDGPTRSGDLNELVRHVHGIQHMVMAQSSARAYPERFRLLGEVIPT